MNYTSLQISKGFYRKPREGYAPRNEGSISRGKKEVVVRKKRS